MITWADLAGVSTPEVRAMLADAEQNGDDQVAEVCRGVIAFREPVAKMAEEFRGGGCYIDDHRLAQWMEQARETKAVWR